VSFLRRSAYPSLFYTISFTCRCTVVLATDISVMVVRLSLEEYIMARQFRFVFDALGQFLY
jgi:hypothetical protein